MGWFGHGLYDGDETQTLHIGFLGNLDFIACEVSDCLKANKTKLTKEMIKSLVSEPYRVIDNMPKIHPKFRFLSDEDAIEWQMLLCLFLDNKLFDYNGSDDDDFVLASCEVINNGIDASEYLMYNHAEEFENPAKRKRVLRKLIRRATDVIDGTYSPKKYFTLDDLE